MLKEKEKHYFIVGILFVVCAYLVIKLMDNYNTFFGYVETFLGMLKPFILAFIIAYIINPVVVYFENKFKFKRGLSIFTSYLVIILLVGIFISFIVPVFYTSIRDLADNIPSYVDKATLWVNDLNLNMDLVPQDKLNEAVDFVISSIPTFLGSVVGSIGTIYSTTMSVLSSVLNFFIAIVVSCFILSEKEKFNIYSKRVIYITFRQKIGDKIIETGRILNSNIGKYLVGKFIDSIFVAICAVIGLLIIGSKYAVLLGTVFGIANMIPYIGPIVTTAVAVLINVFSSPMLALATLICLLIIQQIENLILDPKIVGKQLGLSPFFTFLAVTIGAKLFGIPGMILGTPVMSIIKVYTVGLINYKYEKYDNVKKIETKFSEK